MVDHKQLTRHRTNAVSGSKVRQFDRHDRRQRFLAGLFTLGVLGVVGWQILRWWTRPPAVEFDNLKYIQLLTTAVSSRSPEMVSKVEMAVEQRFDAGRMSDSERGHFQELFALVDADAWEEADRECFEFADAQQSRSREKPASAVDSHDHSSSHSHD